MRIHGLRSLVLSCVLLLSGCYAYHHSTPNIRAGQVVSGPGTLTKRYDYGLIVHFQNGEKNMLMQIQVASDAVRFYDSFYHYNSGETIMLRFLPNDRVAVGGFLFNIISMKEYQ